jgi:hypothetical protein
MRYDRRTGAADAAARRRRAGALGTSVDDQRSVTATYVYCLVHQRRRARGRPSRFPTAGAPRGLAGAGRVRALDAGNDLWLVVADAPLSEYGTAPIERRLSDLDWVGRCAVAHEAVVEHFTRHGTVVPMKLFTLFANDARALARIQGMRATLDRAIARLAHREEWAVRVSLDEKRAARLAEQDARARARGLAVGTRFLVRKQSTRDALRQLVADSRAAVDDVFEALARVADDARRRTSAQDGLGTRLLLDAAFLVPERRRARFRTAVTRAAARLGERGYDVTLTGPWPPYNFVGDPA